MENATVDVRRLQKMYTGDGQHVYKIIQSSHFFFFDKRVYVRVPSLVFKRELNQTKKKINKNKITRFLLEWNVTAIVHVHICPWPRSQRGRTGATNKTVQGLILCVPVTHNGPTIPGIYEERAGIF